MPRPGCESPHYKLAWIGQLQQTLAARGLLVRLHERIDQAGIKDTVIVATGCAGPLAPEMPNRTNPFIPNAPEALRGEPPCCYGRVPLEQSVPGSRIS